MVISYRTILAFEKFIENNSQSHKNFRNNLAHLENSKNSPHQYQLNLTQKLILISKVMTDISLFSNTSDCKKTPKLQDA